MSIGSKGAFNTNSDNTEVWEYIDDSQIFTTNNGWLKINKNTIFHFVDNVVNNGLKHKLNIDLNKNEEIYVIINSIIVTTTGNTTISIGLYNYEKRLIDVIYPNDDSSNNLYKYTINNVEPKGLYIQLGLNNDGLTTSCQIDYKLVILNKKQSSCLYYLLSSNNNETINKGSLVNNNDNGLNSLLLAQQTTTSIGGCEEIGNHRNTINFNGEGVISERLSGIRLYSEEEFYYVVNNVTWESHNIAINLYADIFDMESGEISTFSLIKDTYSNSTTLLSVPKNKIYFRLRVNAGHNDTTKFTATASIIKKTGVDFIKSDNPIINLAFDKNTFITKDEAINYIPQDRNKKYVNLIYKDSETKRTEKLTKIYNNSSKIFVEDNLCHIHFDGTTKSSSYFVEVNIKEGETFYYVIDNLAWEGASISINLWNNIDSDVSNDLVKDTYASGIYEITAKKSLRYLIISATPNTSGKTIRYSGDAYIIYGPNYWLKKYIDENNKKELNIWAPNNIYALEGTKLQIFKSGLAPIRNPYNYDLHITDAKNAFGVNKFYFYEYEVNNSDGDFSLKFGLKDDFNTYNCDNLTNIIQVKKGMSPTENKNLLIIGDSFTDQVYWVAELRRLLTGIVTENYSDTSESNIISDNLINITFIGTRDTNLTPNEGYSGKSYGWFATDGSEINNGGTNPFWNTNENKVDFTWYCNQHSYTKIDYCIILLGTNGYNTDEYVNTVWNALLTHNPNIKVIIMSRAFANPWSSGVYGVKTGQEYLSLSNAAISTNKYFQDHCLLEQYKNNFLFVDYNSQIDVFNNYHYELQPVNQRNNDNKIRSSDSLNDNLHPGKLAYWQIADAVRPAFHYWCLNSNQL